MSHPGNGPFPTRATERENQSRTNQSSEDQSTKKQAQQAKGAASDVAQHSQDAAKQVAATGKQGAQDVAGEAKKQASDLLGRTKDQLNEQVETQRVSAVETLKDLGTQLAAMTDDVDQEGTAIDLVTAARDRVQDAAQWLDQHEGNDLLDEARRVGRQRPGAFLLTAALAGVAAGRLTRGSVAVHTENDEAASGTTAAGTTTSGNDRPTA